MFKKIFIIILSLFSLFFLYQTIGYIVLGTQAPVLYNGEYAYFMGMYIMAITYGILFLLTLIITLILIFKKNKIKNDT